MISHTNNAKPFLRALGGETLVPPPFWLMRQAGRYLPEYRELRGRAGSFLDLCYNPEMAAEVTLQPIRRFAMDAAILFADILLVPQALGMELSFDTGHGPRLGRLETAADVAKLSTADLHEHLGPVYRTVERVSAELPPAVALIGFAGAPWTVATYMVEGGSSREFTRTKAWARDDPGGFGQLIDIVVEATTAYLIEQVRHGAEAVQIFDSWAGALDGEDLAAWCYGPTRAIVDGFREACPDVPIIGFPRGIGERMAEYVVETGVNAVSIDTGIDTGWAAATLQPRCTVQGNLDPELLLAGGGAMVDAVVAILEALGRGPFVFNLGHGVLPPTPPENVALLAKTLRAWRP